MPRALRNRIPSFLFLHSTLYSLSNVKKRGADLRPVVPTLGRLVRDKSKNQTVLANAAELLGEIGPDAKLAVPDLVAALTSDDVFLVSKASVALWKIDQRTSESVPALRTLLQKYGNEPGYSEALCDAVYNLGPAAASLAPEIVKVLEGDDWDAQWAAADALGAIASADPIAVEALVNALDHRSGVVKNAATQALSKLGKDSAPLLAKWLEEEPKGRGSINGAIGRALFGGDPPTDRRELIADALGNMGPDAKEAIPALKKLLSHKHRHVSNWCAIAIAKIDHDVTMIPRLQGILHGEAGANYRIQAVEGLGAIGAPAKGALPILQRIADDEEDSAQEAAKTAIALINRVP